MEAYITICKIDNQWEFAVCLREHKQGLCINLEEWDGEGDGRDTNLYIDADLNLTNILGNIGRSRQPLIQPPKLPLPLPEQQPGGLLPRPDSAKPGKESPETSKAPEPGKSDNGGLLGFLFGGD